MNYSLNAGEWNSVFAIPSGVVDKYIKLASGNSLKLLLFLMRHGGRLFSEMELKDALGFHREGELEDAALFWVQRGIIKADNGSLSASREEESRQELLPEVNAELTKKSAPSVHKVSDSGYIYSAADIAGRIKTDPAVEYLFSEAQKLYGRMLRQSDNKCLIMLVDHYGLPAEVAVLLLKFCFKIDKTSNGYIQAVAATWSEDGIDSIEKADRRISALEKRHSVEEQLREKMELKTKFSAKQQAFIGTWSEEWGFNADMIMLAYDITLDKTGSMNFNYTNKILENWKADGLFTKEAVEAEALSRRNARKSANSGTNSSIVVEDMWDEINEIYGSK